MDQSDSPPPPRAPGAAPTPPPRADRRAPRWIATRWAAARPLGPWLLRDALRVLLVVLLAAVSAWYLTRWALQNQFPVGLAWTLPVLLDASALLGIVVAQHPRDDRSRRKAVRFAWFAALLSAAGNGAMHAVDFGALQVNLWTVVATGALYPLFLAVGYDVANGMAARPARPQPLTAAAEVDVPARGPAPTADEPTGTEPDTGTELSRDEQRALAYGVAARWGERELREGRTAGWKRIRSQFPRLSEHFATEASAEAKRLVAERVDRASGT